MYLRYTARRKDGNAPSSIVHVTHASCRIHRQWVTVPAITRPGWCRESVARNIQAGGTDKWEERGGENSAVRRGRKSACYERDYRESYSSGALFMMRRGVAV